MKKPCTINLAVLVVLAMIADAAWAGGTGGAFVQPLLNFLVEAMKGYLGTLLGIVGLIYGLVRGVGNGSIAGLGIGAALAGGAYFGPDLITAISSATVVTF